MQANTPTPRPNYARLIIMAIAVLLVIILGAIFFLTRSKDKEVAGPDVIKDSTAIDTAIAKADTAIANPDTPVATGDTAVQTTDTATVKPTADAGPSQSIKLPKNDVLLKGAGTAGNGSISTYHWVFVSGPSTFKIGEPNAASTLITGLVAGLYTFKLDVTDNKGNTASDIVQINVGPATGAKIPPTANAGPDRTIMAISFPANATTTLNGSGTDPNTPRRPLKYSWRQALGPSRAIIANPIAASTAIRGLNYGTYTFELAVTDFDGLKATNIVRVTVMYRRLKDVRVLVDPKTKLIPKIKTIQSPPILRGKKDS